MKLQDLLEKNWNYAGLNKALSSTPHQPFSQAVRAQNAAPDREYVGSGAMAYVDRSTSPHEIDNVHRLSPNDDGTSIFHRKILETPAMQTNPYMPRVRAQKSENGIAYTVIERLVPLYSRLGNLEVLNAVWDRMFDIPFDQTEFGAEIASKRPGDLDTELRGEMCSIIERLIRGRASPVKVIDRKLSEAIKFLQSIHTEAGSVDLHDENVMFRMTGTMPQLVFTDPFA